MVSPLHISEYQLRLALERLHTERRVSIESRANLDQICSCIRGMRVPVSLVVNLVANGMTAGQLPRPNGRGKPG